VGNQDKRGLLVLNETNNVVETVLDVVWLLADILLLLALSNGGSLGVKTLLLLNLGLGAVLVEELEGLGGGVAVQSVLELSNGRWNLEAEVQDLLLALKTNILGPLDKAAEVALGLDVLANTEVAGTLLDERVLGALLARTSLALRVGEGGGLLSGLGGRLSLRKEDQQTIHQCCIFFEL
jgi:hypothetical protein